MYCDKLFSKLLTNYVYEHTDFFVILSQQKEAIHVVKLMGFFLLQGAFIPTARNSGDK